MDIIDIVLSKKYTDESLKGITGTLAGKNCTIKSTTKADGVTTVVFAWTADDGTEKTTTVQVNDGAKGDIGIGIDNVTINANSHLIVTLSDGSTIDAGLIQGGSGTDDYEDLINRPKIEGVDLIGNKTFEDLGVASATDLAQTDGHLQDLADLVGDKANLPMPNDTVVNNIEYVDTKVDGLIDDNITGLTKTFSSDKIAKKFATLEEVNERIPQYEIMPTATESCGGQVVQFIGTTTSDYTHGYFYECVLEGSGYIWKNIGVQAIPVNLSELTNDSGYITVNVDNLVNYYLKTETYSQAEVDEIIGKLNRLTTEIVTALPTENISTTTIYLIKVGETNNYTQHMYIGDAWADLGSTTIDLSGYVSKQQLTTTLADYVKSTDLQAHVDNNTVHLTIEDRDNLTNLLLDEHNHANKTILDGILQAQVDNWNEAFTDKHTHDNKTVLDGITSTKVSDWDSAKTHADSAHAPSNAQENVVETVKVNGTALTPSNKAVNIDLSDYAKTADVDASISALQTSKADLSTLKEHTDNVDIHVTAKEKTTWGTVTNKVDKEEGKGLSSNDYTSEEKTKLGGVGTSQGRNLIPYPLTDRTTNGITYTVQSDGSVLANGTASAENNAYYNFAYKTLKLGDTSYTLSCEGLPKSVYVYVYDETISKAVANVSDTPVTKTFVGDSTHTYSLSINVGKGTSVSDLAIKPILEMGTIAHAYEPISESNVNLKDAIDKVPTSQGRNLIHYPYYNGTSYELNGITYTVNEADGTIIVNGTATKESDFRLISPYDNKDLKTLELGQTYTLSDGVNKPNSAGYQAPVYFQFVRIDATKKDFNYAISTNYGNMTWVANDDNLLKYGIRVVVRAGVTVDNVVLKPMLEVGAIAHSYEPTTDSNISLKSAIDTKADKSEVCVNILNPTLQTTTKNGVTCTNNEDGTYTVNGTVTKDFTLSFINRADTLDMCQQLIGKYVKFISNINDIEQLGHSYMCVGQSISEGWGKWGTQINNGKIAKIDTKIYGIVCDLHMYAGDTFDNVLIKPMLTTDLNATYDDFVPYTGNRGSLNWDVAELKNRKADKSETTVNLLKSTLQTTTVNGVTCTNNGDGTYTFSGTATDNVFFDINKNILINKGTKYKAVCLKDEDCVPNKIMSCVRRVDTSDEYTFNNGSFVADSENCWLWVTIAKGATISNLVAKPMLTTNLSATYDDFVPYTGDGETLASDVAEIKNDLGGLTFSASGTTLSITDGTNTWTLKANS